MWVLTLIVFAGLLAALWMNWRVESRQHDLGSWLDEQDRKAADREWMDWPL